MRAASPLTVRQHERQHLARIVTSAAMTIQATAKPQVGTRTAARSRSRRFV